MFKIRSFLALFLMLSQISSAMEKEEKKPWNFSTESSALQSVCGWYSGCFTVGEKLTPFQLSSRQQEIAKQLKKDASFKEVKVYPKSVQHGMAPIAEITTKDNKEYIWIPPMGVMHYGKAVNALEDSPFEYVQLFEPIREALKKEKIIVFSWARNLDHHFLTVFIEPQEKMIYVLDSQRTAWAFAKEYIFSTSNEKEDSAQVLMRVLGIKVNTRNDDNHPDRYNSEYLNTGHQKLTNANDCGRFSTAFILAKISGMSFEEIQSITDESMKDFLDHFAKTEQDLENNSPDDYMKSDFESYSDLYKKFEPLLKEKK